MRKGIFCISIDLELLWGRKDKNKAQFMPRINKERFVINRLLGLFRKYDIPTTWVVVGKLFEKGNLYWSGKDVIKLIKSYPNQEIGCHTYSHKVFSEINKIEAIDEIEKSVSIFKKEGIKPTSFVFPRNRIKYLNLLYKYGFKAFRGKDCNSWELLAPSVPPVYQPSKVSGLVNIQGSMYFVSSRGIRKYLPFGLRYLKSRLGINNAARKKKVFHLWFHPVDFVDNQKSLLNELEMILKYASQQRKKGKLEIKTMEEIADEKNLE